MHVFYLHGFASSALSTKAAFLASHLARHGLALHTPDLNEPDFATLTTTRMIGQVEAAIAALPPGPVVLVGSSLGAFVAWHVAARAPHLGRPIDRLVLLAPALDFGTRHMTGLTEDEFAAWQRTGWHTFHHYAYNEPRAAHFALYEDAQQFRSSDVAVATPGLVLMGRHDTVVSPAMVERFCQLRPNLSLVWLDDDHQLAGSLDLVWEHTAAFIGLPATA